MQLEMENTKSLIMLHFKAVICNLKHSQGLNKCLLIVCYSNHMYTPLILKRGK